jgi:predicted nuclease of restriction endonuclease-like (RecB) superfamily
MPDNTTDQTISTQYQSTLQELVVRVKQAQYNALKSFSSEKVMMSWDFGKIISEKATNSNWGSKVIENLSKDLQIEFAGVTGFSFRDLKYMRQFYETYNGSSIGQTLVAQISWSNNKVILDKCKDPLEAEFYIKKSINNGWSKYDLIDNIKRGLYNNTLLSQNNFEQTLEVADELKQRLAWDFRDDMGIELINGENPFAEKEIEESIMASLNDFLLSMDGKFSFVGRQVKLQVGDDEFFVDLLFYHLELNCYVAMELKATKFKPEHLGQIEGYMAIIDNTKRKSNMNPTIGILVCREKNRVLVEYLLSRTKQPIGVSTYNSGLKYNELDKDMQQLLPSEEEITNRLSNLNNN